MIEKATDIPSLYTSTLLENVLADKITKTNFLNSENPLQRSFNSDNQISGLSITEEGVLQEIIIRSEVIFSRIIEMNKQEIILECLMDKEKRIYRERKINKNILDGVVSLEVGRLVLIHQRVSKGKIIHEFEDGENIILKDYFIFDDPFKGMENISFGKKL
jgi:hypothetical protein